MKIAKKDLVKSLRSLTGVDITPEQIILQRHIRSNFAVCIITRQLRVPLSITNPADNLRLIKLNNGITSDIEPEKLRRKIRYYQQNIVSNNGPTL